MFNIILYQPEIPPNTGNVIRLSANVGARLHLVKPLGFELNAARLRRAGMDYAELADVRIHENWTACLAELGPRRLFALSTKGTMRHDLPRYADGDCFVFGPETSGLPKEILHSIPAEQRIRLPMTPGCRSLNLSNSVAVVAYEAWRQLGFAGGA
ncbi:MAG: tRNA (cytidine(34)-2'-O)-methyltransferase [Betaproteobacteria bacterium]|nr:tRNA (cytidine(34)-2'-O)-methyltransferase [Betaproteobacteria bacterium]